MSRLYNERQQVVGEIDDGVFVTERDYPEQVFWREEYGNGLAVSVRILDDLDLLGVELVKVLVRGLESKPFFVCTTVKFLRKNGRRIWNDYKGGRRMYWGDQLMMPLKLWTRVSSFEQVVYGRDAKGKVV